MSLGAGWGEGSVAEPGDAEESEGEEDGSTTAPGEGEKVIHATRQVVPCAGDGHWMFGSVRWNGTLPRDERATA